MSFHWPVSIPAPFYSPAGYVPDTLQHLLTIHENINLGPPVSIGKYFLEGTTFLQGSQDLRPLSFAFFEGTSFS